MGKDIELHLDESELKNLKRQLDAKTQSLRWKVSSMEHELLELTMRNQFSGTAVDSRQELSEKRAKLAAELEKLSVELEPLESRLRLVTELLNPDSRFWLTTMTGGAGELIDQFLGEVLGATPSTTVEPDISIGQDEPVGKTKPATSGKPKRKKPRPAPDQDDCDENAASHRGGKTEDDEPPGKGFGDFLT